MYKRQPLVGFKKILCNPRLVHCIKEMCIRDRLNIKAPKASGTIKKLKNGKTYYIKIRAYTNTNGKKIYGKDSDIKKIKL